MAGESYLKQAKQLFRQEKFEDALTYLQYHLEDESDDVRALVLKAASEQRLHKDEQSISTFKRALELAPTDIMIWKGLIRTYFQARMPEEYFAAVVRALNLIATAPNQDELYKEALSLFERCQDFILKISRNVPPSVKVNFLELQLPLPDRPAEYNAIYNMFEGRIFPNYASLNQLIELNRKEMTLAISKIKSRKKTSINFSAAEASNAITDAITESKLESLYELKISMEDDDDSRRDAEAELLKLLVDKLENTNAKSSKQAKHKIQLKVKSLAEGMAMFEPKTPLAFEISWDWEPPTDSVKSDDEDDKTDRQASPERMFIQLFPLDPLAMVLTAQLSTKMSEQQRSSAFKKYKGGSVYGWQIITKYFVEAHDYEAAIDSVHSGMQAIKQKEEVYGMKFPEVMREFKLALAKAYSNFQAPKNFPLAQSLFDEVLADDPENIEARVGKGYVLSQSGDYKGAMKILENVVEVYPNNVLALSELSWSRVQFGDVDQGIEGLKQSLAFPAGPNGQAELKWRIGYSLWKLEKFEESFEWFVSALQENPAFAPAYTNLGLFYKDVVHDTQRARRSFYKALELDNGQAVAGEYLASDFALNKQWDLVEVVASTVLSSDKIRTSKAIDWPYRAMGIVCINSGRYAEAVKFFQRSLKTQPHDVQAWIGLGESYIYSGRYRSAEKALTRALKLDPKNFSALYILSLAQSAVLDFPASAASLQKALKHAPSSSAALLWAVADNSLRAAEYFASQSMLGESLDEVHECLKAASQALGHAQAPGDRAIMWGTVASAFMLLHRIGRTSIKSASSIEPAVAILRDIGELSKSSESFVELACSTAEKYVELAGSEAKPRRATSHYCAALAYTQAKQTFEAVAHFKAAIALEPKNDLVWSAYGVCLQELDPLVAQHCYVRSLALNGRSADTWVRLAGLYIMLGDTELAAEALDRAQSLDPDSCRAWIGQALVESLQGSKSAEHLQRLLMYAYSLSQNDRLGSYAFALKDYEIGVKSKSTTLGALEKLMAVEPNNRDGMLLMGLILEQKGDFESALTRFVSLEEWCHAARAYLALGQYNEAISAAEKNVSDSDAAILSCLLTTGLAQYFLKDLDAAIEAFTLALEHDNSEDVLRLLVEVLYAIGTDDARQVALDQLFDSIASHGPTLQVTLLLAVLGILSDDSAVIEAAKSELTSQITPEVPAEDLAQACHVLSLVEGSNSSFQRALFQRPTEYALWRRVDKAQALIVAEGHTMNAKELSCAHYEAGGITNCQRAVFFDPTSTEAWRGLATSFVSEQSS